MDREQFSQVFYGEGPVPAPWATDCPVKFEVWWAYSQSTADDPVDLILAVGEQQSVALVFEHVRHFPAVGPMATDRRPVLSGAYIAIKLTFGELIALVVPLTSLGRKIGSAREVVASSMGSPLDQVLLRI